MKQYGALEAGGTKMVMSILDEEGRMLERTSIPTRTPEETMPEMIAFFGGRDIVSLGIGCFGPLELDPASPAYGSITATPKLAWRHYPIRQAFIDALGIPVGIDTDVNVAALAEVRLGAARGLDSCVYVTIGTGIGGGVIMGGKPVHGLMHPEMGHQLMSAVPEDPTPDGFCPYHKHCLEGLAAGPAIEKRWGVPGHQLARDHQAWTLEAEYLAQMCHNAIMNLSPQRIILGGGVMGQSFLLDLIRARTLQLLEGYIHPLATAEAMAAYIVAPGLGVNSGVMGAWLLAREAE